MLPRNHLLHHRYRIIRPLGQGGFGQVYEAMDDDLDCLVAVKERHSEHDSPKLRRAFEREAKLLANLRCPVLPKVTAHFFENDKQYLVMEFIEGDDLAALLHKRQRAFTIEQVMPWALSVLQGLEYLHSRPEPVIHRDIKPANIKLTDDNEVFLIDFGLAKGYAGGMNVPGASQRSSSVHGYTAAFAPLEQLNNSGTDAQSDLYSLGATLYQLLTNEVPRTAAARYDSLDRHGTDCLPEICEVNAEISPEVSRVVAHAMALSRKDRIRTATDMRLALLSTRRTAEYDTEELVERPSVDRYSSTVLDEAEPELVVAKTASTLPALTESAPGLSPSPPVEARPADSVARESERRSVTPVEAAGRPSPVGSMAMRDGEGVSETPGERKALSRGIVSRLGTSRRGITWGLIGLLAIAALVTGIGLYRRFRASPNSASPQPVAPLPSPVAAAEPFNTIRTLPTGGRVWSVAFAPDGSVAASAGGNNDSPTGADKGISIWDTGSWERKLLVMTDQGIINSVAFSPDSSLIASGGNDGSIKVWRVADGTLLRPMSSQGGHQGKVLSIAFSPNGRYLVSASVDRQFKLWDVATGLVTWSPPQPDEVRAVAFSPDGSYIASTGDAAVSFWDVATRKLVRPLPARLTNAVSFSSVADTVAAAHQDGSISLWNWRTSELLASLPQSKGYVSSVHFLPDGKTLVSGSRNGGIILWEVPTGKKLRELGGGLTNVESVAVSPDGATIISGGRDGKVNIWN